MTDQEWAQSQRHRKWRKMLHENSYKAMFGASEDLLKGKGLTDWEWVYKTFPKWMLQEMGPQDQLDQHNELNNNGNSRTPMEASQH